jgi:hypothetical protein
LGWRNVGSLLHRVGPFDRGRAVADVAGGDGGAFQPLNVVDVQLDAVSDCLT